MDPLAHVFLPLLVAYAIRPALFDRPWTFGVAGFGLLPDADKFLGLQGLGHSLVAVVPLSVLLLAAGRALDRDLAETYALLAVAFLASHLLLDAVDGGPVPLLYPLVRTGAGLTYPATLSFGEGVLGVAVHGPVVAVRTSAPSAGYGTFGFVDGSGVASALAFAAAYVGRQLSTTRPGGQP